MFGKRQFAPENTEGQRLLAHELTHVVQQGSYKRLQRKEIPEELLTSVDLALLSEDDLHKRYDLITSTLSQNQSSLETARLLKEAGNIGIELTKRALAAGRTFSDQAILQMKQYFISNAQATRPDSCIGNFQQSC